MFEELKIQKFLNLSNLEWSAPLLTANFGDGYGAGILTGSAAGLHRWSLSADLLPDLDEYSIDYVLDDDPESDTRFEYLFSFIKRHTALGAKPFRIKDPRSGKFYLASFEGVSFGFEALTAKLFRGGVTLNQRRARGVPFNVDGSLFAAPDNFKFAPLSSTAVLFTWDEARNDNLAGYELWFDGVVYDVGNVLEYPFGSLVTGSEHTAKIRSYKAGGVIKSDYSDPITFVVAAVTIIDNVKPSDVTDLAVTAEGNTTVDLDWKDATDNVAIGGYLIQRATNEQFTLGVATISHNSAVSNRQVTGLLEGVNYFFRVKAKDAPYGNLSENWSNVVSATTSASTGYTVTNFTPLRTLDGSSATEENLLDFAMTMISDLAIVGSAATRSLNNYAVANFTPKRSLDGTILSADDLLDFVMTVAFDLSQGGNLSAYAVGNFTASRSINGATATLEQLLDVVLTAADDLGAANTAP